MTGFDSELLNQCVSCGLCLTTCPTYQVTFTERHNPRGRIAGMRLVASGEIDPLDPDYVDSMESCVQCRACEPACPSNVQFGALMEHARADLQTRRPAGLPERVALAVLARRRLLRLATFGLALLQALRLDRLLPPHLRVPLRVRPWLVVRPAGTGTPAYLYRGCVMDAWFTPVHRAVVRVLAAAGHAVRTRPAPSCCGALHLHAGREREALRLAQATVDAYAGTTGPIVVDSGGCGAMLKEYGRLLATPAAAAFSARVRDVSEVVTPADLPPLRTVERTVAYQSACHLRNVQRIAAEPVALLRAVPGLRVTEPADGQLCCGAGGAYSVVRPDFAVPLRERKAAALAATGASAVVSGNPGCALHLAAAGLEVVHPAELVAEALPER